MESRRETEAGDYNNNIAIVLVEKSFAGYYAFPLSLEHQMAFVLMKLFLAPRNEKLNYIEILMLIRWPIFCPHHSGMYSTGHQKD